MPQLVMSERSNALKAFFSDLERLSLAQENLFSAGDLGIEPAEKKIFVLPENTGDIEIFDLCAVVAGVGWGKTVMSLLTALADRHGLDVYLRAVAVEEIVDGGLDQIALEAFYGKFGFADIGNWNVRDMFRRAKTPTRESEDLLDKAFSGDRLWQRPHPGRAMA